MCTQHQRFIIYNLSILGLIFILLGVVIYLIDKSQKNIDRGVEVKSWKLTQRDSYIALGFLLGTIVLMIVHKIYEVYYNYSKSYWYIYVQPGDWII
jgi:hypothetical protein